MPALDRAKLISNQTFRLTQPTQIDIFRLWQPRHRLDCQLIVVTHFDDEPDLAIREIGKFRPDEIPAAIESYLAQPRWERPLPDADGPMVPRGARTYHEALSTFASNMYQLIDVYMSHAVHGEGAPPRSLGMGADAGGGFHWVLSGGFETTVAPEDFVRGQIERSLVPPLSSPKREPPRHGVGAFILPGIWVVETPEVSVAERLRATTPLLKARGKMVLQVPWAGSELMVTQDGFFAVPDGDKELNAEKLNTLFAAALFTEVAASSIAADDLFSVTNLGDPGWGFGWDDKVSDAQVARFKGQDYRSWPNDEVALPVREAGIRAMASLAEHLLGDDVARTCAQLSLEGFTHVSRREWRAAFLSSWSAIEVACAHRWRSYVQTEPGESMLAGTTKRLEISKVIRQLTAHKLVSSVVASRLNELRDLRNHVLHEGQRVGATDARRAVATALSAASSLLSLPEPTRIIGQLYHEANENSAVKD